MLSDEIAEVGFVIGTDCLFVLPPLRYKGPLHFHCILQEKGQLWAKKICGKQTHLHNLKYTLAFITDHISGETAPPCVRPL